MNPVYHTVRQVLHGTRAISPEAKFVVICIGVALVHLHFTIAFAICGYAPLSIYNLAVTLFYMYHCFVSLKKKRYVFIYVSSVIEILFHSSMVSILLGWDWGFMFYTIALVPVAFYLSYTLISRIRNIAIPVFTSIVVAICYIMVMVISDNMPPIIENTGFQGAERYFYYFNTMIMFGMLFLFSILFALEIRYMQKRMEQENLELEELAMFDPLTHLMNRRSMNNALHQAVSEAAAERKPFCLIMADIDDFKKINDTYGHDCGDEVLIIISNIISNNVRENDCVCRWGGEEILILLQADVDIAKRVAERVREEIADRKKWYRDADIRVTITLGIAEFQDGLNIRSLIDLADRNLYIGKNNGKNQVVV